MSMSSSGCDHRPGSLCDHSETAESDASKASEEPDPTTQVQYITNVMAKDGSPLPTTVESVSLQSDVEMCRICHEEAGGETLLSPCDCTGTLGKVHRSCLENWLSSSNTSFCELCHKKFPIERRSQPLTQWVKHPGLCCNKHTLLCNIACFLLFTPLVVIVGWNFLRRVQDHLQHNRWQEAVGLIVIVIIVFALYSLWLLTALQYHCSEWRRTHRKVRLLIPEENG